MYPAKIAGFLPYLSLHGPKNKDKNDGKMLSMKDLLIKIELVCGCTSEFNRCASALLLFSCRIRHSVWLIPNVTVHVRYTIKSVRIVPAKWNKRTYKLSQYKRLVRVT